MDTTIRRSNIFKDNKLDNKVSELVEGTNEVFYGNPMKAAKHKKKNIFVDEKNIEEGSVKIPKDIMNLIS